ncbi:MAG TPA: histidinol-phosphate transaminase [Acidimicrobiales bacterium]|nr:histidinol-phosphate transaminase [Acidimicrobiales bacterium]
MTTAAKPRAAVELMEGYHSPQLDVEVRLNTNESPFAPPAAFTAALGAAIAALDLHRYPDRSAIELREALAAHHGVRRDQVFAANGSNEVLQTLLLAFAGPGRSTLVFEPTYALHSHIARLTGSEVVIGERSSDFTLDTDVAATFVAAAAPAVTFLCSPNNPTGCAERADVIEAVAAATPNLVVVDEAYGQFAPSSAIGDVREGGNVVVVRTFSKTWALAGLRLGYVVAPSDVVATLEKVALPYHLDAIKQVAGVLALGYDAEMRERVATLVAERERTFAALRALDVEVWPSDANFVLFRPRSRSGAEVWDALVERSIVVRNCASWPGLSGCLRVTIGTRDENDRFLEALTEVLAP